MKDLHSKYKEHVSEREKRRLNFNRKDRWKQRDIDDVYKNFDVKNAKFKDFSKIASELKIFSKLEFRSIDELFYYIENLFKEGIFKLKIGMLEDQISSGLSIFLKEIFIFKEDDMKNKAFVNFVRQLSQNILSFTNENNYYKTAKFLDWYNINDINIWFNLERVLTRKRESISSEILVKVMDHFSNQNEGSDEYYDMYQYLFWSGHFDKLNNSLFISLGYNLFLVQGGKFF